MVASRMPAGWDLDRIRACSGDQDAEVLDTDWSITADPSTLDAGPLRAVAVFGFHDLVVVRLSDDDDWHMGDLDRTTATIHLWSTYNAFEDALRGL
jgi:hypothetical protein